jgi:hypothetical protein
MGSSATIRFAAISNKTYTIQFTDSLRTGLWSKLADFSARTTNRIESVVDSAENHGARFYRLVTPQQD